MIILIEIISRLGSNSSTFYKDRLDRISEEGGVDDPCEEPESDEATYASSQNLMRFFWRKIQFYDVFGRKV